MKTVKKVEQILRKSDEEATEMVNKKGWSYCKKSEWKKIRNAKVVNPEVQEGAKVIESVESVESEVVKDVENVKKKTKWEKKKQEKKDKKDKKVKDTKDAVEVKNG